MREAQHDVLIVGGGVIGLACAHALLRAGRGVTVLDAGRIGAAASHGNCGTLTPSHAPPLQMPGMPLQVLRWMLRADAPFYVRPRWDPALFGWLLRSLRRCNRSDFERTAAIRGQLLLHSRERIEAWIRDERLDCGFEAVGTLYAFRDRAAFDAHRAQADLLRRVGVGAERLDAPALHALEPALNDSVVGGYLHPDDAHLRPDRFVAALAQCVRRAGADLREHVAVDGWLDAGGTVRGVRTGDEVLRANDVLVAAGSWSPTLLRGLGLRLPVQPGKGYSITYDRPSIAPRIPLVLKERSVCVTAWPDGYRLGSTMEFSGYDATLNRLRLDRLRIAAAEYLREPEGPCVREEWYGWRPMTPDDLPVIGAVPSRPGLWLATGHGMLGMTLSAATGELAAALMCGGVPAVNPLPFSPARWL
jgi:D-amino-acid dehydrogenase